MLNANAYIGLLLVFIVNGYILNYIKLPQLFGTASVGNSVAGLRKSIAILL